MGDRYEAYRQMIDALNTLDPVGRFSLAGTVMTQVLEEADGDTAFKHRAIDEFAKTAHGIIDRANN